MDLTTREEPLTPMSTPPMLRKFLMMEKEARRKR